MRLGRRCRRRRSEPIVIGSPNIVDRSVETHNNQAHTRMESLFNAHRCANCATRLALCANVRHLWYCAFLARDQPAGRGAHVFLSVIVFLLLLLLLLLL